MRFNFNELDLGKHFNLEKDKVKHDRLRDIRKKDYAHQQKVNADYKKAHKKDMSEEACLRELDEYTKLEGEYCDKLIDAMRKGDSKLVASLKDEIKTKLPYTYRDVYDWADDKIEKEKIEEANPDDSEGLDFDSNGNITKKEIKHAVKEEMTPEEKAKIKDDIEEAITNEDSNAEFKEPTGMYNTPAAMAAIFGKNKGN